MQPLIRPEELQAILGSPELVVVDCRFTLTKPDAGQASYSQGHIPGAVYAHLDKDLSGPHGALDGRHPLPEVGVLAGRLSELGISDGSKVVVYDDSFGSVAGRLWCLLKWLGHEEVALLDGGWQKWVHAGGGTASDVPAPSPGTFHPKPQARFFAAADEVDSARQDSARLVIDARSEERFSGEIEPFDKVAGHIPGSINWNYEENIDFSGYLLPPEELKENFDRLLQGRDPAGVIHVCGSGVTACQNLIAMEAAGLNGSRLYVGSWSEWITDPRRPIATGPGESP